MAPSPPPPPSRQYSPLQPRENVPASASSSPQDRRQGTVLRGKLDAPIRMPRQAEAHPWPSQNAPNRALWEHVVRTHQTTASPGRIPEASP
ncbi:hypothetical protein PtB15_11B577 [Puccinia triticina]|nr:hypothetical protein PtB15_11B577 [Puccinia triticina]